MPTVTVLAWCLIASTGRVSSSIARVSDAVRSSISDAGRADLAGAAAGTPRAGRSSRRSREQRRQPHRGRCLEMAVVQTGAQPVAEPVGMRPDAVAHRAQHVVTVVGRRPAPARSPRVPRAADAPRRRSPAPPRSRTGARPSPTARTPAPDRPPAPQITAAAAAKRSSPSVGDHDRRRLVGLVDRHLLGHVVGGAADQTGGAHEDQRLAATGRCASCPR